VQPASNAASKIGITKRGSALLRITVMSLSRANFVIDAGSDASSITPLNRESPVRSATPFARPSSMSAMIIELKKSRRFAMAASAAPTPPEPITRIFMAGILAGLATTRDADFTYMNQFFSLGNSAPAPDRSANSGGSVWGAQSTRSAF